MIWFDLTKIELIIFTVYGGHWIFFLLFFQRNKVQLIQKDRNVLSSIVIQTFCSPDLPDYSPSDLMKGTTRLRLIAFGGRTSGIEVSFKDRMRTTL